MVDLLIGHLTDPVPPLVEMAKRQEVEVVPNQNQLMVAMIAKDPRKTHESVN